MNRTARTAAGAVALAVALGTGSPVAGAAPNSGHGKPTQTHGAHGDHGKGGRQDKGDRALRRVLRAIAKEDARLARVQHRSSRLGDGVQAALSTNIDAERQALADLEDSLEAGDGSVDLGEVRDSLRELRSQNYEQVVNWLRQADRFGAKLDAAAAALAADPAAPQELLDLVVAAQDSLDAAVTGALAIDGSSSRDELRAVQAELAAAHEALGAVLDYLEGDETEGDESEEESSEEGVDDGSEDPVDDGSEDPVVG